MYLIILAEKQWFVILLGIVRKDKRPIAFCGNCALKVFPRPSSRRNVQPLTFEGQTTTVILNITHRIDRTVGLRIRF